MTPHPTHLRTGLCLISLVLGLAVSTTPSAQTYKQRQQGVGHAAMAIEAYAKSVSQCHYDPAVGRALAEVERFFEQTQPYAWQKAKREAPYGLNMTNNMCQAITGRAGGMDCKAYGTLVSNGLFFTMATGKADPVVMAEMERLANDGGRPRTGAGPSSPSANAGSKSTTSTYEAGSFPLSAKDVGATIKELKGIDTDYAVATGTVTRDDAEEYCTRDPGGMMTAHGGKLSLEQCIASILEERKGKVYRVEADCAERAMRINGERTYRLDAIDLRSSDRPGFWLSEDGEVIEGASAAGDLLLDMRFKLVCPARWEEVRKAK